MAYSPSRWHTIFNITSSGTPKLGANQHYFRPCDLENWQMTLKNNRVPLLCPQKLYLKHHCRPWIQRRVIIWNHSNRCQIGTFSACMTLKFDRWPWTRQIWGIWKLRPAYSPETHNLGLNRWCFVPCDLEILWMTLENNRASLLCCFKLFATFHSHRWIQTGVTVRKRAIWVKFNDF